MKQQSFWQLMVLVNSGTVSKQAVIVVTEECFYNHPAVAWPWNSIVSCSLSSWFFLLVFLASWMAEQSWTVIVNCCLVKYIYWTGWTSPVCMDILSIIFIFLVFFLFHFRSFFVATFSRCSAVSYQLLIPAIIIFISESLVWVYIVFLSI